MATSWKNDNNVPDGSHAQDQTPKPEELSALDDIRERVGKSVSNLFSLLNAIRAPLPTQTGDGSELPKAPKDSALYDLKTILRDIHTLGFHRVEDLAEVVQHATLEQPINDKTYLMERLIQAATCLTDDTVSKQITQKFVTTLWNDLEHPPQMLLSDDFIYRQPDGSKNNYLFPNIGKAGMPYARTVTPKNLKAGAMPDPGTLFDACLARKDAKGTPHPNKVSSMLFYLASIIIHDCFKTNRDDYNVSDTSSYLDLAPLYGSSWADQKLMRTFKDGKIKPDCFSETRLLSFPPGVGALLIMFNRHHNYVVEQLASINEDGRFTENSKKPTVDRYGDSINRRDDDLFQTGRLITCGLYVNIILLDYVRTILNLNRTDDNWALNPRTTIPDGPQPGTGNQVSCEFNLVYRWHSAVSERDDLWTQALFKEKFSDVDPTNVATPENMGKMFTGLKTQEKKLLATPPEERPFPALDAERLSRIKEGPYKGSFNDDDLAKIITEGIEDCANAMGPQQVPTIMKIIEILGIMQARTWRVGTLNEFRQHFALEPHYTFESITDNKEVADALKHLYGTPNNVELYPGLLVEDAKRPMLPGSGLCPSYTVSRGVLSDATALVRGDRFYTTSYTPAALTNWGYQEASSNVAIDNGCVMYKLFLRALPNNFDPASVYVHYPFTIPNGPDGMKDVLTRLGKAHKYNFDKPAPIPQPKVVFTYDAAKTILNNQEAFYVTWGKAMEFLMGPAGKNFMLAGDGPANAASRKLMYNALYMGQPSKGITSGNEKWLTAVRDFYEETTINLLKDKGYSLPGGSQVDIIRDVGNLAHVHFGAEMFSIPLKTKDFPHGIFTEAQLYLINAAVFTCVFFDVDPPKSFPLRQQAYEATQMLGNVMQVQVAAIKNTGKIAEMLHDAISDPAKPLRDYGVHMIAQLCKEDRDVKDIVWGNIMGTLGGMVAPQGQLFGQIVNFYLGEGKEYWPDIVCLAKEGTPAAEETLMKYVLEAIRLQGETGVMRWARKDITVEDKNGIPGYPQTFHFKKGDKIMVNLKAASRDKSKSAFGPNADKLDLNHPIDRYIQLGDGAHQCLGLPMTRIALTTMLKVVAKLENLKPATMMIDGNPFATSEVKKVLKEFIPGDLAYIPESWHYHAFLTEDWDMLFPFPTSESDLPPHAYVLLRKMLIWL
jgi:cytochrome P450